MENYARSTNFKSSSPHQQQQLQTQNLLPEKRYLRSIKEIKVYHNSLALDRSRTETTLNHGKRTLINIKGSLLNSESVSSTSNNNDNSNPIAYEHLGNESWIDLVLPITILSITVLGVLLIGIILFIWIKNYINEKRSSQTSNYNKNKINCTHKKGEKGKSTSGNKKMNSRKWLKSKPRMINNQVVSDGEQKLETIEYNIKNSPPTSPNAQKLTDEPSDDSDSEPIVEKNIHPLNCPDMESEDEDDETEDAQSTSESTSKIANNPSPIIIPVPMPVPIPIPLSMPVYTTNTDYNVTSLIRQQPPANATTVSCESNQQQIQQITCSTSSSLSLLQEEVCCIQPREEPATNKFYKSIATSPPPFSPLAHSYPSQPSHKYATTGTQTFFTKSPNSPNISLFSPNAPFTVLQQTPTVCTSNPSTPPITVMPSDNKENKEPTFIKLRNVCLNKSISNFKQDNGAGSQSTTVTTPSYISTSPKIVETSPKLNTNVLQQQNSPLISSTNESPHTPPLLNRFSFSPKILSTNSPTISSANYKFGNYFRFPDVDVLTPQTAKENKSSSSNSSSLAKQSSTNTSDESTADVPILTPFQSLSMEINDKESIFLKIDEVESPVLSANDLPIIECSNNNNNGSNNTLTIRRARLKSISLDSDGARLVEENLGIPVEELVEITSYNNKQITDLDDDIDTNSNYNNKMYGNLRYNSNPKNIYNLTINLDIKDSSLNLTGNDINMNVADNQQPQQHNLKSYDETDDGNCRTPTMKYFRHKAISLDSDNLQMETKTNMTTTNMNSTSKMAPSDTFNYYFGQNNNNHKLNSSISVPSTPKHLTSNKLKISNNMEERSHIGTSSNRNFTYCRKLGSFEENSPADTVTTTTTTQAQLSSNSSTMSYKSNLTASIQQLNVSNSNLKTLPEIMSISDFDGPKPITRVAPMGLPPSKSGILQRRGSNHSLTLNLDGSCGNLSRGLSCSNYSLGNWHGSHLNITGSNYNLTGAQSTSNFQQQQQSGSSRVGGSSGSCMTAKKNLLQRRGSNTSLSLNIQESNNNLNRFNSHSSLNMMSTAQKKGLLERRNSNASLTLNIQNRGLSISNCNLRGSECSLSSVNTNQINDMIMMENEAEQEAEQAELNKATDKCHQPHQRKFLSSENLHNLSVHTKYSQLQQLQAGHNQRPQVHQTPYGSIDNLKHSQPYHLEKIPVISTKPLSPQSTSEDFKIYLANIQYLQSASNVLDQEHLRLLNNLFQKSYNNQPKVSSTASTPHLQRQFNNDDVLNNKMGNDGPPIGNFVGDKLSPDEDQKELLIKLHQEFWNLPTNYQEKPMVFGSQSKNRYKTILPNEHSRVILQREDGFLLEPYINANFIKVSVFSLYLL